MLSSHEKDDPDDEEEGVQREPGEEEHGVERSRFDGYVDPSSRPFWGERSEQQRRVLAVVLLHQLQARGYFLGLARYIQREPLRRQESHADIIGTGLTLELFQAPVRQASTVEDTAHRPWPLPERPWVMGQTWDDLLFAHYRVPVETLRRHVPDGLELQEHSGSGWVGVTPFVITGLRARGLLPLPFVSSFRELNVRTYVTRDDKPGIWFFSLDASSQVAVEAARRLYRLPYFRADISVQRRGGEILYDCSRGDGKAFSAAYRPDGSVFTAEAGSLEEFLTERYCLYAEHEGNLCRADIHHRPWPLQPARARIDLNTMPPFKVAEGDPLVHYSARQDVVLWALERA